MADSALQQRWVDADACCGFHREALILKYSWPPEARKQQVQVLRQMYVDRGSHRRSFGSGKY